MEEEKTLLLEQLKNIERMKVYLMSRINAIGGNRNAIRRTTVYPMAKVKPLLIDGYPVFQFSYEGALPLYKEDDRDYLAMIRHYYFRATIDAYDFSKIDFQFDKSVIIIAQHYENKLIRDLDNRNRKLIQDAIRHTGLIGDDSWWRVWNVDIGFLDPRGNHVHVYVVSQDNFAEFIELLKKRNFHLAHIPDPSIKEGILKKYESDIKEKDDENERKPEDIMEELSDFVAPHFWG
ncbi:hypothetical protein [Sporosarcina luteola]|uniref:hypothetical protein n=1 Tax=Sporosarcina luteola TaxID=582850 RepID=UPI00203A4329|nr:hypothetical protein [Sporosarcina luteola]MCM3711032.1 hypothetical protein [Sporosarcina luteola]